MIPARFLITIATILLGLGVAHINVAIGTIITGAAMISYPAITFCEDILLEKYDSGNEIAVYIVRYVFYFILAFIAALGYSLIVELTGFEVTKSNTLFVILLVLGFFMFLDIKGGD